MKGLTGSTALWQQEEGAASARGSWAALGGGGVPTLMPAAPTRPPWASGSPCDRATASPPRMARGRITGAPRPGAGPAWRAPPCSEHLHPSAQKLGIRLSTHSELADTPHPPAPAASPPAAGKRSKQSGGLGQEGGRSTPLGPQGPHIPAGALQLPHPHRLPSRATSSERPSWLPWVDRQG